MNTGVFPYDARLQKWDKHPDGICKRCREMGLKLLGGRPDKVGQTSRWDLQALPRDGSLIVGW